MYHSVVHASCAYERSETSAIVVRPKLQACASSEAYRCVSRFGVLDDELPACVKCCEKPHQPSTLISRSASSTLGRRSATSACSCFTSSGSSSASSGEIT